MQGKGKREQTCKGADQLGIQSKHRVRKREKDFYRELAPKYR